MFSAFAVDPTMSQKRTVISFRSSATGSDAASGEPQASRTGDLRVLLAALRADVHASSVTSSSAVFKEL